MRQDPHRPAYHFSAAPWMNDPIPFFWEGQYHVFFQHNPASAGFGLMHWGHAVSRDLAHWEALPIALAPTPGSPDQEGCWTGCVVESGGRFHILYTGIPRLQPLHQVQCLASSEDLVTWEKYPGNPVIADQPEGFGECFRDPCVWKEAGGWYMVIGSELPDRKGGAALLYRSEDLKRWGYLHPLFVGDTAKTGHDFECPDFFPLGDLHVLLTSRDKTHWHVGRVTDHRFALANRGVVDGGALYAAKTLLDDRGRRLLWGWIREERPGEEQKAAGWSGVLSLPRVLSLRPDGSLGMEPAAELDALRGRHWQVQDLVLSAGSGASFLRPEGIEGDALELQIQFEPTEASSFGAMVRCSRDGTEGVEIAYDRAARRLGGAPLDLGEDEDLILRIYVDRSVIEAFANGRACHTARCYPEREDSLGIRVFARGGSVKVKSMDAWEMRAIR